MDVLRYDQSVEFKEKESYKHKFAKEVLKEWFIGGNCMDKINFSPNRPIGVWLEYPIVVEEGTNSIEMNWDEIWPYDPDFRLSENSVFCEDSVPTFKQCIQKKCYPKRIIDVVLSHKGVPAYFIEVCYRHPIPLEKVIELYLLGVRNLIEVDADWVLRQIKRPNKLKYIELISSNGKINWSSPEYRNLSLNPISVQKQKNMMKREIKKLIDCGLHHRINKNLLVFLEMENNEFSLITEDE
jgi:hypothetical protein